MKIIFLCGSLEPGRDGVGDYTRCLAAELLRTGHKVIAVAINDSHILEESATSQSAGDIYLPVLRIPSILPEGHRFSLAKKCIDNFNPQWLSLQFVPFSFHPRGLSFSLAAQLEKLGKGRHWHIMFHELWVGMDTQSSVKYLWWGRLQQKLITSVVNKLKPAVINTHTKLYLVYLRLLGFDTHYLPLFSNIPVLDAGKIMRENKKPVIIPYRTTVSFVLFAAIHAGAPAQQFAKDVAAYCGPRGIKPELIIIGRSGAEWAHWANAWKGEGLDAEMIGEQPASRVSEVLSYASAGITTTPFALAEKSGAAAAMREHGLPVICVSYPWTPRGIKSLKLPGDIIEYPDWDIEAIVNGKQYSNGSQIGAVSANFINALCAKEELIPVI